MVILSVDISKFCLIFPALAQDLFEQMPRLLSSITVGVNSRAPPLYCIPSETHSCPVFFFP